MCKERHTSFSNEDFLEKAALAMVSLHLGLVADSADILGEWRGRRRGRNAA